MLCKNQTFVAYGIYAYGCSEGDTPKLESIVGVNLQAWSSSDDAAARPTKTITIPNQGTARRRSPWPTSRIGSFNRDLFGECTGNLMGLIKNSRDMETEVKVPRLTADGGDS